MLMSRERQPGNLTAHPSEALRGRVYAGHARVPPSRPGSESVVLHWAHAPAVDAVTTPLRMAAASLSAGGPALHGRIRLGSLIAGFLTRSVGRGARTVRFVDGTNRDGSLVVRQLGWVPVTVTSARLITPALVAGDCTLT